jgi:hypothetical protein
MHRFLKIWIYNCMSVFKTTSEILDTPWQYEVVTPTLGNIVPDNSHWHYIREIEIEDVKIWEQIYYKGGHVGIYAAWDPYAEFYIIVYNLFIDVPGGIKTFYGPTARSQVEKHAKQLGINLAENKIWVDEINSWQYIESTPP